MKFCKYCGNQLKEGQKFCSKCGHEIVMNSEKETEKDTKTEVKKEAKKSKKVDTNIEETKEVENLVKEEKVVEQSIGKNKKENIPNTKKKPGKTKFIVIAIIVVVVIAASVVGGLYLLHGKDFIKKVIDKSMSDTQTKDKEKEPSYVEKYADYIKENVTLKDTTGVFLDVDGNDIPELVLKSRNNNEQAIIEILSIHGSEIRKSEEYVNSYLKILYKVENKKPEYFFEERSSREYKYYSLNDVIKDYNTEISDEDFEFTYVKTDVDFDLYDIRLGSIKEDLENLYNKYLETKYITDAIEQTALDEISKLEASILKKDDSGIYNENIRIAYGTYASGYYEITLNKDGSAKYSYTKYGNYESIGSYYLKNDTVIVVVGTSTKYYLKLAENNKFNEMESSSSEDIERVYNLK